MRCIVATVAKVKRVKLSLKKDIHNPILEELILKKAVNLPPKILKYLKELIEKGFLKIPFKILEEPDLKKVMNIFFGRAVNIRTPKDIYRLFAKIILE